MKVKCSRCGTIYTFKTVDDFPPYCTNCGAKLVNTVIFKQILLWVTLVGFLLSMFAILQFANSILSQIGDIATDSTGLSVILSLFAAFSAPILILVMSLRILLIYGITVGFLWILYAIVNKVAKRDNENDDNIANDVQVSEDLDENERLRYVYKRTD